MKFYKRDPDRALAGMLELTFEQRGAYNSLLDLLYSRDGKVPDDDVRVARMMSAHWRQWRKLKKQLIEAGKIWVADGYLYANRVQETLKEAADFSQEQRKKAAKRWVKSENANKNNDPVMPPGNALTPTPTPTVNTIEPNGSIAADAASDLDALLYRRGRELLGKNQGAMITKLKRATGSVGAALDALEVAKRKDNPGAYIAGICQNKTSKADRAKAEIEQGYQRWRESNERG